LWPHQPLLGDPLELDLTPFVDALRKKDAKKAGEWLEQNKGKFDPSDEFHRGYLLALGGMVASIESGSELSVIKCILDEGCKEERVKEFIREARDRLSLKFRPSDEQGFDTAWVDVLQGLLKEGAALILGQRRT